MILRAILVDDEPLALSRLRRLLAGEADVEVVAECSSGAEAVEAVKALRPDVLFLDIEMPVMSGFEVISALQSELTGPMPAVIFKTAYGEFSLRAFEFGVQDYLLKPTSKERLRSGLERVRARLLAKKPEEEKEGGPAGRHAFLRRVTVRSGEKVVYIPVEEIQWIEAAGNYVVLHCQERREILRVTLGALEEKLSPEEFLRISRSALVRLDFVVEVRNTRDEEHVAVGRDGTELRVTRNLRELHARVRYA